MWCISTKNTRDSPLFRVIQPSKTKVCKLYLTSEQEGKNKLNVVREKTFVIKHKNSLLCLTVEKKHKGSLVIEQNIGALYVSVQKVLFVAVIEALQQLSHERLNVALVKMDQARLEQSHQIVVHVFKHKVEST